MSPPMDAAAFLQEVRQAPWYRRQIVHVEELPPREARHGELEFPLHPLLERALVSSHRSSLYLHQAQAINALHRGANVVVCTPAASGKSLCYHLPVLQELLQDPLSRAIYIFPTKALAQDQLRSLLELAPKAMRLRVGTFDGDTPAEERQAVRRSAQVVITNPDMLHMGILPNHRSWARLFQNLRFVVVDEAHVYRGVFGSHVANVLRRLRRVCVLYGSQPRFVLASATIANPGDLAERLVGLPFTVVDQDGSPYGGKTFAFWDPPVVDERKMTRRSTNSEATLLFVELLRRRVRSLAFVRTRKLAELIYRYTRDSLRRSDPELAESIRPYRGTYLAEERRAIERALFQGQLLGAVATNALELGIDIGDLGATILTGYPGSVASTWQQAGRSGRRGKSSFSALVAQDNPLDQYLMRHPEFFFGRSHERALIAPENPYVLAPHLLCAAYELRLTPADEKLFGSSTAQRLAELVADGKLRKRDVGWYLGPQVSYPAAEVNIRSASSANYLVVEDGSGKVLEQMDEAGAFYQVHPGAVFLHLGESFVVQRLDLESRTAFVTPGDVPYYTQPHDITDIRILEIDQRREVSRVEVCLGKVDVSHMVVGFKRKAHYTEELLAEQVLDLPTIRFKTVALWFGTPAGPLQEMRRQRKDLAGGLHAMEHAAIGVLPLFAMCDRNDIGGVSTPLHPDTGQPQVFIYDGHPGGIGIAEEGFRLITELWDATLRAIKECPCADGCPGCIQSPKCGNNNQPLDKAAALMLLEALVAE